MSRTDEFLEEARKLLQNTEELLKKYPNSFSLKISVRQWKDHIAYLEEQQRLEHI